MDIKQQFLAMAKPAVPETVNPFGCGTFVDLNQEMARLQADSSAAEEAGCKLKMLARYPEFRIVLVTMNAGSRWQDHKTSSRISVQVVRGRIEFHTSNGTVDLHAGQLLTLDPDVVHSVSSFEDSAFLLTLSSAARP